MIKMKRLPDNVALQPNYKGCEFLGFFKIKVKDIKKVFENTNKEYERAQGKNSNIRKSEKKIVNEISKCISENPTTWDTKYYEPPIISENGELYMGGHRIDGFEQAGETYITVAVVKFIHFENKSPLYWLRSAQGKENNTPIIKNQGSDYDTIKIVLTQIEEKTIKSSLDDIETSLKDQGIGHGKKRKRLIKLILEKTKNKSSVEIPNNYNSSRKKKYFKEKYPNSKLSTLSVFKLSKIPKNININDNNDIHFVGVYNDDQDRYPIIHPFNLLAIGSNNPESQIYLTYSVNADNIKQVKKMRKFVPKNFERFETMILKMADHIRSKNYKRPIQISLPQLKEDKN